MPGAARSRCASSADRSDPTKTTTRPCKAARKVPAKASSWPTERRRSGRWQLVDRCSSGLNLDRKWHGLDSSITCLSEDLRTSIYLEVCLYRSGWWSQPLNPPGQNDSGRTKTNTYEDWVDCGYVVFFNPQVQGLKRLYLQSVSGEVLFIKILHEDWQNLPRD